jgi:hypothetical protein
MECWRVLMFTVCRCGETFRTRKLVMQFFVNNEGSSENVPYPDLMGSFIDAEKAPFSYGCMLIGTAD